LSSTESDTGKGTDTGEGTDTREGTEQDRNRTKEGIEQKNTENRVIKKERNV
jgi:hypothetical protein